MSICGCGPQLPGKEKIELSEEIFQPVTMGDPTINLRKKELNPSLTSIQALLAEGITDVTLTLKIYI